MSTPTFLGILRLARHLRQVTAAARADVIGRVEDVLPLADGACGLLRGP